MPLPVITSGFSPLLAFSFANPWLLWGLALGGIPVVIHLLHKRRYREVDWAAMKFLLEAARKNSRRLRLEQLVLLMVRILILMFLVMALAQPYFESFGIAAPTAAPVHRIIVVDSSFSMAYRPANFSRFEEAKAVAQKIASGSRQGDALNLARIAGLEPRVIVRAPSFQKRQVVDEIGRLRLTDQPGHLAATLEAVLELLAEAPEIEQKKVYFISDAQRETWMPASGEARSRIHSLMRKIEEKAGVTVIDVGGPASGNVAVSSLVAEEPFVVSGRPVHLLATARNFGRTPRADQLLELYVDGRLAETRRVDLAAGGDVRERFSYTFETSGEHRVEARLEGDSLTADNRRWLALPVREELRILLVNGRPSGRPSETATFYLQKAFAPATSRKKWSGFTRPTVIDDGELTARDDLSRYDCIFLCDVATVDPREAEVLETYLKSGGGVVFCLGDQVRAENYNNQLFGRGDGILPARLGDRAGDADDPREAFRIDAGDLSHPIVNVFQGNPGTGLEQALVFEYMRVEPRPGASVALRLTNGDPLIVTASVGRGRSILLTTSADTRWSPWPVQRSFPPIVHETVHYAVTGRWDERQRLVGEPLTRVFPTRAFSMSAKVRRPDGAEEALQLGDEGSYAQLAYEKTLHRGIYEVVLGVPLSRTELFAVNLDSRESDLTRATEEELSQDLFPGLSINYDTKWQEFERRVEASDSTRGSLARWLLLATLCLIFVELLMAWNFYYGLLLLYAVAAAAFVQQAFSWSLPAGVLGATALAAGLGAVIYFVRGRLTAA